MVVLTVQYAFELAGFAASIPFGGSIGEINGSKTGGTDSNLTRMAAKIHTVTCCVSLMAYPIVAYDTSLVSGGWIP